MTHAEQRERRKQIAAAVAAGESVRCAAERFGVEYSTAANAVRENGVTVERKPQRWEVIAAKRRKKLVALYLDGLTLEQIADLEGVSKQCIHQILQRAGVDGSVRTHRYCSCGERYEIARRGRFYGKCQKCRDAESANRARQRTVRRLKGKAELASRLYEMGYSSCSICRHMKLASTMSAWVWQSATKRGIAGRPRGEGMLSDRRANARMPIAKAAKQIKEQISKELAELNKAR